MKPKFRSNPFLRTANRSNLATSFGLALCLAGLSSSALAGSADWNLATGTAAWNANANWNPNTTFPNGVGEIANVTKDLSGAAIINLSQDITVGTLLLGDTVSSATYTVAPNGAFSLFFDNTGSTNAVLTDSPASGTGRQDTISANCVLNDSLDVSVTLNSLQLTGTISEGSAGKGLSKMGTGVLNLLGTNTYTGTTTIENGVLAAAATGALGTGTSAIVLGTATSISSNLSPTLRVNGATTLARDITVGASNAATSGVYTLDNTNSSTAVGVSGIITLNQNLTVSGSTTGGCLLSGNITTGSAGARTLTFSGTSPTVSGVIGGGTGTIALVKSGGSTLTLTGSNTFTGGTSIGGGTLNINSDAALGAIPGSPTTNVTFTASSTLRQNSGTSTVSLDANRAIVINSGVTATLAANATTNVLTINGQVTSLAPASITAAIIALPSSGNAFTSGTVVLAGNNNFAADSIINLGGGANIGGGILRVTNPNALGTNAIVINGNAGGGSAIGEAALELYGGVTVGSTVTLNVAGRNSAFTAVSDNLRSLSGTNFFNGTFRINSTGGNYQIDSAESGTLFTFGGTIANTLNSTRVINFIGAGNTLFSGTTTETGGANSKINLAKYGSGTLTLSNANTFLGGVSLNLGTLNLNNATALGSAAGPFIISGGTIDNTSGTAKTITNNNPLTLNSDFAFSTSGSVAGNGDLNLGTGATTLGTVTGTSRTITTNGAAGLTIGGVIANGTTANSIIKSGTGSLTLSGASTFTGGVTLNAGTLNLNSATAIGTAAGTFIINGGTIDNTSTTAKTLTSNNPLTLNGDFAFSTSGSVAGNGDLSLGSGATTLGTAAGTSRTITTNGAAWLTIAGVIANGTTANSIIKSGSGVLKLDAVNTYTGGTTLNAGSLHLTSSFALGSGTLTINGGTIVARGASRTIGNAVNVGADFVIGLATFNNQMNFSGNVDLGGATRTITVVDNIVNPDSIMSGVVSNGGITKSGNGTLNLSGPNTFTGPITINQGGLNLSNSSPLPPGYSGAVTINGSGAKLFSSGSIPSPVTLTQGGVDINGTIPSLTVADSFANTVATGNGTKNPMTVGTLTFAGAATLNLANSGPSSIQKLVVTDLSTNPAAVILVNASSSVPWQDNTDYPLIEFTNYPSASDASHFALNTPTGLNPSQHATLVNTGTAIVLRITTDALLWTGIQSPDWSTTPVGGFMNWTVGGSPVEYADNSSVNFDDTSPVPGVNLATDVSPYAVIFNNSFTDYTFSSTGGFGIATGSLTKNGAAKTTLSTNNTYSGSTTITAGTLEVSGSIAGSSSIAIATGGTLSFDLASSPNVYSNPITGSGSVIKNGLGALTLSGANTVTGNVTLNAGTLNFNAPAAWGGAAGTLVINGGTLDNTSGANVAASTNKAQQWNVDFTFTGSNNLDLGTGTVTLGGSGDRVIVPGGAGDIFTVGEIKSTTLGLTVTGGGTLVATSIGTFTDGSNIGGTLTVDTGTTLQINRSTGNSAGTTGDFVAKGLAGSGTITNGAALSDRSIQVNITTDYSFAGTLADGSTAALALNKQGAGTLTLTGASSYGGQTVLGAGALVVKSNTALGAATTTGNSNVGVQGSLQLDGGVNVAELVTTSGSGDGNTNVNLGSLSPTAPGAIRSVTGVNTLSGSISLTAGGAGSVVRVDGGSTLNLTGPIAILNAQASRLMILGGAGTGVSTGVIGNNFGGTGVLSLAKADAGTWTLTGTNTYTGTTTINAGTLQLGNGTTDGTIVSTGGVVNNAALVYNWTTNHTAAYVISGSGSVTKTGAGTATLSGVNTYTGTTTVNAGELAVNGTSIVNSGTVVINGGKVNLTGSETVDKLYFGGVQQPAGSYTAAGDATHFSGAGTLIVVTGPPGYDGWASANGVTGGANGDSDNDGISNLVEYALNLNPAASDGTAGTFNGTTLSFSKRALAVTNADVTYSIEVSTDLGGSDPWTAVSGVGFTNNSTTISYDLPSGPVKNFSRLKVTKTP